MGLICTYSQQPNGIAIRDTGISIKLLAKLLEGAYSVQKKASTMPMPVTHTSPAMAYHSCAIYVASVHVPQALFVGFGITTLHTFAAHPTLVPHRQAIPSGISMQ